MEYTNFGKTGLRVSVAGLGCGGASRLGAARGKSKSQSVALVRMAMDLGVNFLDTAAAYGTEGIVGEAIKSAPRNSVVVATKALYRKDGAIVPVADIVTSLDNSLRELDTDHVDIFHFHAVRPRDYTMIRDEYAPACCARRKKASCAISASPKPRRTTPTTRC